MLLSCTNKGCYSNGEHLLDESDDTVYCIDCGKSCDFPRTTKITLKTLKQIKKQVKSGLQFTCKACKHTGKPLLKVLAGKTTIAVCRSCNHQLDIHTSFIQALLTLKEDYESDDDSGSTDQD